jgi:periplasmic copper chaperone A
VATPIAFTIAGPFRPMKGYGYTVAGQVDHISANKVSTGSKNEKPVDRKHLMKQIIYGLLAAALFAALSAGSARAEEVRAGDLVITQVWGRATPGGSRIGGGYLTVENRGSAPDRLIGGSAEVAGRIEVHEMSMNNGVMTMRPLDNGLSIEPGQTARLAPGGYHLMLFDLKSPLRQGDKVPVTLEFEKAGKVMLSLDVLGIGARGPVDAGGSDDQMKMPDHSGMKK